MNFPKIFDLCWCGCNEIVYDGKRYKSGHNSKGKNHHMYNKQHSKETKIKMSKKRIEYYKIHDIWNKGKIGIYSEETLEKMRTDRKDIYGINNPNYNNHLSAKAKLSISMKNKNNKYRLNKKHSQDSKDKISETKINQHLHCSKEHKNKISKALNGKNNPSYGKPRYHVKRILYDSTLQGEIYLRSSYELAYAKYLDSIGELWYYEIETFDLGDATYTPDFFLPRIDKFIEIKGYMYPEQQIKIDKFLEQYPWDLEILYKEDLVKLGIEL